MTASPALPLSDASFHGVQRRLAALLPTESWLDSPAPLELSTLGVQDPPRLISASILEGKTLREYPVIGQPEPRFAAFLDGTQTSRVIAHVDGVPIVYGSVAAVIRQRIDRRMRTWDAPRVRHRLYAPLSLLSDAWRTALASAELPMRDTLEHGKPDALHPFALQDAAIHAVQADREALERELAELWCDRGRRKATGDERSEQGDRGGRGERGERGELFVDGAITGSEIVASAPNVVGVIKSHRTLYAEGDALRCVLRLQRGERTSVFRITSPRRTPVASWYLRLRESSGRDPLWGLVRVEVAEERGASSRKVGACANDVSRWVLAETLPLAVPDGRWDKMVYGIRDCEEFLRAIQ